MLLLLVGNSGASLVKGSSFLTSEEKFSVTSEEKNFNLKKTMFLKPINFFEELIQNMDFKPVDLVSSQKCNL